MPQYYTQVTAYGAAQIAAAGVAQATLTLTDFALGDGGGVYTNPTSSASALVNEVWRGPIGQITVDPNNALIYIIETEVPANVGGWEVREMGIFDAAGNLFAIVQCPQAYKPLPSQGAAYPMHPQVHIAVATGGTVALLINQFWGSAASAGGLTRKFQIFKTSGVFTPSDKLIAAGGTVELFMHGGGGGGNGPSSSSSLASIGGASSKLHTFAVILTPVVVTVGAGGLGGAAYVTPFGGTGGDTSVGTTICRGAVGANPGDEGEPSAFQAIGGGEGGGSKYVSGNPNTGGGGGGGSQNIGGGNGGSGKVIIVWWE